MFRAWFHEGLKEIAGGEIGFDYLRRCPAYSFGTNLRDFLGTIIRGQSAMLVRKTRLMARCAWSAAEHCLVSGAVVGRGELTFYVPYSSRIVSGSDRLIDWLILPIELGEKGGEFQYGQVRLFPMLD